MKEVIPDAEIHMISLHEVVFGTGVKWDSNCKKFSVIISDITVARRNGRGSATELLLPQSSGHSGHLGRFALRPASKKYAKYANQCAKYAKHKSKKICKYAKYTKQYAK